MEKLKLARNICKTVYGLRFRTLNGRMRNIAEKLGALSGDLYKVTTDPNYVKAVSTCPKAKEEAQHVDKLSEQYAKSFEKLGLDYIHFKQHEEPNLMTFNMFRNYVAPFGTAALGCLLLGAEGYGLYVRKKYTDNMLVEVSHNRFF